MLNKFFKSKDLKLNSVKFGIAGGLTTSVFVLIVEIFVWIKLVPLYNSFMINIYGTEGYATGFLLIIFLLFIVFGFILGFVLTYLFAWIYNRFLSVKVK